LPLGVSSRFVEASTNPATDSNGQFFFENVLAAGAFDTVSDSQTTWTYNFQSKPGTYYIHVAGLDTACFFADLCPVREFSQMMTVTIPNASPPSPPAPPPLVSYPISVSVTVGGSIQSLPAGIDGCRSVCTRSFTSGTALNLTATPDPGYVFAGWGGVGGPCGTSLSCNLTVSGPASFTAVFALAPPPPPPPLPLPPPVSPKPTASCHVTHTCPSTNHKYRWHGLLCGTKKAKADNKVVAYRNTVYWCHK
jgi:List-Bact-rpt repeat protein